MTLRPNRRPLPFGIAWLLCLVVVAAGCSEGARERRAAFQEQEPALLLSDLERVEVDPTTIVRGETVYVPAYSQVFTDADRRMPLAVSLSISNTDSRHPIIITSVKYFGSRGTSSKEGLVDGPVELPAMSTVTQAVGTLDMSGGEGANFLVEWVATARVSRPLLETVMVSRAGGTAMAFTSRGEVVDSR